jgi:hypothetical protein
MCDKMESSTMEVTCEDIINGLVDFDYSITKGRKTLAVNMGLALRRLRMSFILSRLG